MRESFKCENCGQEYTDSHELISLSGENFCGNCSDEFHFIYDEYVGFIALKEVAPIEEIKQMEEVSKRL